MIERVLARARNARWPRLAMGASSLFVAGAGLLASTELHGIPSQHAIAAPAAGLAARGADIQLADERGFNPAPPLPSARLDAFKGSPESRLIGIYQAIGAQKTETAIAAAAALTRDVPSFRLAQMVYADLLSARIGRSPRLGLADSYGSANLNGQARHPAVSTELNQLLDEAVARLQALRERPPPDQIPAEFVVLPKAVHHAIAVDTSRSRLYLFENGPQGLRLVSDHYVSVGKQGVDKTAEGDQRTPLGVYFVSDRVGLGSLEQRFGAGALQLNYPNAFDRLHGRTGRGIYLHGVPPNTYSRPPKDSDGCVVLANDELITLMNTIPLHDTPVVITRRIKWVESAAAHQHQAEMMAVVNHWQSVRADDDVHALEAFYAPGAVPALLPAVMPTHRGKPQAGMQPPIRFGDLSVLTWTDTHDTMVVTFRQRTPHLRGNTLLRQYWTRDHEHWKIVAEGAVR